MSFQYVSSMRRPLGRNQAANVDPSAETLSRGHSLARILGVGAVALVAAWLAVKAAFVMARDRGLVDDALGPPVRDRANIFVDLSRTDSGLRLDAGGC